MEPIIELQGVHKRFGTHEVLRGVSCGVPRGRTTVFVGPSGTGKSVLIKLMVGLLMPDSGAILFEGEDLRALTGGGLMRIRKRMGKLFQDGALFDSVSVFENIAFPLRRHRKLKEPEIREIVTARLAEVGLRGVDAKFPGELSGGMRKRVGLARALVLEPDVVFFDEPTSGLDPVTSAAIDELVCATQERTGATFVVISHDIPSTRRIAHTVGMLYDRELVAYGEAGEILDSQHPVLRQFFDRCSDGPIQIV